MPALRLVRAEDAVGKKLAMDYSIVTPERKGALFRRGHIVRPDDVEALKVNGHYYVYVLDEEEPGAVHEDEAVLALAREAFSGSVHIEGTEEGKAVVKASANGLVLLDSGRLAKLNASGTFTIASRRMGSYVRRGDVVAVVDLIPLLVEAGVLEGLLSEIRRAGPIVEVRETRHPKVGVVIVGSEIVDGLKEDLASPVVTKKLIEYDCKPGGLRFARDDEEEIARAILESLEDADAVVAVGGMSVDPTDRTPHAIRRVASEVVAYGLPIKPTTMTMVAYRGEKPIIGVSSGVIFFPEYNALDVLLPWVSAGLRIPRDYLASLGDGGLSGYFLSKKMTKAGRAGGGI